MYWIHVLNQLLWGFHHIHCTHSLYAYYVHHHALGFLRSGITSGSGGRGYLRFLTAHHVTPIDW